MRYPADASPEAQRVFEALWREIEAIRRQNTDLHKRKFINAGPAVSRGEFVTKGQLDDAVTALKDATTTGDKRLARAIGGPGHLPFAPTPGGLPGPIGGGLPVPNHPMDLGYYKVDTIQYGKFADDVKSYTNLTYIDPSDCGFASPPTPVADVFANLKSAIARLAGAGLKICLSVDRGSILTKGATLQAAQPYWDKVKYVFLGDELDITKDQLNTEIVALRANMTNLGLPIKPVGVTFTPSQILQSDRVTAQEIDVVGVENYMIYTSDPTGALSSSEDAALMKDLVERQRSKIPATKGIILIVQAYDLNGSFTKITPNLVDLQSSAYLAVYQDTRVQGILMFSYGRPGGTKDHPELIPNHRSIWAAISGGASGTRLCSQGRPCCGGTGNPDNCPRWCSGGNYQSAVASSYLNYVSVAGPTIIDPATPNHILDIPAFMNGVVAQFNAEHPELIAQITEGHDGKEISVKLKGDTELSEQYALWLGAQQLVLWSGSPPQAYRATCYPASF